MELFTASQQWASRPADERFTSLLDLAAHTHKMRDESHASVVSSRRIEAVPVGDNKGLMVIDQHGVECAPTHWAFGQLAALAEAPARYLRTLASPLAADCLNYGLKFKRDVKDVGLLVRKNGEISLRAATGPGYGRIWNSDVVDSLVNRFGDGVSGDWRVPGEWGQEVVVTKENTTLYASDRDMFVFLADEKNRIEIPNRRNGETGTMARGFFVWNSEVGSATFGIKTFLFDFVCGNRIVWGAEDVAEVTIRHTASAPDKFLEQIQPALTTYANGSSKKITDAIEAARAKRLGSTSDEINEFLAKRFTRSMVEGLQRVHELEEGRPIETMWDAVTAITASARGIKYQDERVELEEKAGALLKLAA